MKGFGVGAALVVAIVASVSVSRTGRGDDSAMAKVPVATKGLERATFAMGCFWSAESAFEGLPGVKAVTSGYTGGHMANPAYEDVSSGTTGHVEAVQILYDPKAISYNQLLDVFWHNNDPTTRGQQFSDRGTEYESEIFYDGETQHRLAEASKKQLESTPQRFKDPIVTMIRPAATFYPAEVYHQDFYKKSTAHYQAYRIGSGHDARLEELWGKPGRQAPH
jgi:peptide-methionine (S)-S-oxide reductase